MACETVALIVGSAPIEVLTDSGTFDMFLKRLRSFSVLSSVNVDYDREMIGGKLETEIDVTKIYLHKDDDKQLLFEFPTLISSCMIMGLSIIKAKIKPNDQLGFSVVL